MRTIAIVNQKGGCGKICAPLAGGSIAAVRTIAIVNQKGGCGKTSTAINLAAVFAHRGLRTLLVDMDPQAHCAIGLGVPEGGIEQSVAEALLKADRADFDPPSAVWEVGGNLDLLPSTMRLAGLEAPGGGLHELSDRDRRLTHLVGRFAGCYDRCLIDCPPTIGLLTFNALRAAREALIPVETGFFALRGADMQWKTIHKLIERIGRPIACHLLPTLYNADSALAGDILAGHRVRPAIAGPRGLRQACRLAGGPSCPGGGSDRGDAGPGPAAPPGWRRFRDTRHGRTAGSPRPVRTPRSRRRIGPARPRSALEAPGRATGPRR
ncbi:MAG: ParA family protein [Planctomycetota bacterium]